MEKTQRKPWFSKKPIFTNVHEIILRQFFNQMWKFDRQWFRDCFIPNSSTLLVYKFYHRHNGAGIFHPASFVYLGLLVYLESHSSSFPAIMTMEGKVHIFWEGHKILRNFPLDFDRHYIGQKGKISQNFVASSEYMNFNNTPGPRIMQIHLVRNSTTARFEQNPKIFT